MNSAEPFLQLDISTYDENLKIEDTVISESSFRNSLNSYTLSPSSVVNDTINDAPNNTVYEENDLSNCSSPNSVSSEILIFLNNQTKISPTVIRPEKVNPNTNLLREILENTLSRLDAIEVKLDSLSSEINICKLDINSFKEDQITTQMKIKNIEKSLRDIDTRSIRTEQYVNRESLIISGIPESIPQNKLEATVLDVLHSIGLFNVSSYDVAACHRLKKNFNDPYPPRTIIRFTNRKIVQFCLRNRQRLLMVKKKTRMNLRFYESLCLANEKILKKCNELKKYGIIQDLFISNGFVKIIRNDNNNPFKINHPDMLNELFPDFFSYERVYNT